MTSGCLSDLPELTVGIWMCRSFHGRFESCRRYSTGKRNLLYVDVEERKSVLRALITSLWKVLGRLLLT